MEADLVKGAIGSVGDYDLAFTGGKLVVKAEVKAGGIVDVGATLAIDADAVITALEKAVPGAIPTAILEILRAQLKK